MEEKTKPTKEDMERLTNAFKEVLERKREGAILWCFDIPGTNKFNSGSYVACSLIAAPGWLMQLGKLLEREKTQLVNEFDKKYAQR